MIRFSTIEFEDELYILAGKVDKYALDAHEELQKFLMMHDNTERVVVWCTVYALNDNTDVERDLRDSEIDDAELDFQDWLYGNKLTQLEDFKVVLSGALPIPFEDYYNLQGTEREEYLKTAKEIQDDINQIRAQLKSEGYTEDQMDEWFRYNYYTSDAD